MAAEIAPLGFDIDTSALVQGAKAADALANSLNNVANATDKVDGKSAEAAVEVKKVAEAEKQAAISAEQLGKAVVQAVTAMTKEQEAARQAAEAIKKKEEADKKAAAAAKKAAEEEAMRSTIMGRMALAMREMQGAAANSNQHVEKLTGHMSALGQALQAGGGGGLQGGLTSAASLMGRFSGSLGPVGGALLGITGGVAALGAAFMGVVTATASVQDRFALLEGRLKNVYGSATTAKQVFADLTALSYKNAVSVDQTAESFLRLARNNEAIGLTRKRMVELTDAVQMLGRVSGASTGELASGMLQFSQALASGRLNGDELRSIMENMPALAKAIAQGLGVSVGQIRAMGAAGELTGDKITKAILNQLPAIRKEFEGLPQTTEQAFTRVGIAWDTMLGNMGQKLNSSSIMQYFASGVERVINKMNDFVRDETPEEARRRIYQNRRAGGTRYEQRLSKAEADDQLYGIYEQSRFAGMLNESATAKEERNALRSPYVASQPIIEEIDPARKRVQELKNNIASLQTVLDNFKKSRAGTFEPQEIENINRYNAYISQLKKQLEDALPAFEKFKKATNDSIADAIKYGYQGAGFGADVRKLTGTIDANGNVVSEGAAVGAVTQKRIFDTNAETDALNKQIEAQQKRIAAIGQGKAAEREAEASAKALEYQYRTFGLVIGADAKAAVDAYKAALLGLSTVQDMAAAKQAMLNAQIDLAAAKAGAAAAAAGGGAGAVAEAQRNARRAGQLATADDPASMAVRFAAEDIDRRTGEAAQLRTVRTSAAMQRRIAGGMSPADARRAAQEQEARQFSEGFSSGAAREVAYQEKLTELRARDAANARKQMDDRQQALSLVEKETQLTKTGSLEERVALARAREMNAIRQEGVILSQDELNARLQIAESEVRAQDNLQKAQDKAQRYKQMWDEIGQSVANSLDTAFSKLLDGQKVKLKDFLKDMMKDIAMILLKAQITGPLASGIGNLGSNFSLGGGSVSVAPSQSAFGNVFSGGHLQMYAAGGIVASPTLFPMARGAGLMGEAGPEAVLPLKRGTDGRLGVAAGASNDNGVQVVVNDMRGGGERVQTEEERGPDGKRFIRLTIRDEVKGQIKGGTYDPEMSSQYGARRVLARR